MLKAILGIIAWAIRLNMVTNTEMIIMSNVILWWVPDAIINFLNGYTRQKLTQVTNTTPTPIVREFSILFVTASAEQNPNPAAAEII